MHKLAPFLLTSAHLLNVKWIWDLVRIWWWRRQARPGGPGQASEYRQTGHWRVLPWGWLLADPWKW